MKTSSVCYWSYFKNRDKQKRHFRSFELSNRSSTRGLRNVCWLWNPRAGPELPLENPCNLRMPNRFRNQRQFLLSHHSHLLRRHPAQPQRSLNLKAAQTRVFTLIPLVFQSLLPLARWAELIVQRNQTEERHWSCATSRDLRLHPKSL